jgi:hypothetical protein
MAGIKKEKVCIWLIGLDSYQSLIEHIQLKTKKAHTLYSARWK